MTVPRGYVGHARDLLKGQCFPDPKIRYGAFRVLPRTDGLWIVFDDVTKKEAIGLTGQVVRYDHCANAEYAAKQLHARDRRPEAADYAKEAT